MHHNDANTHAKTHQQSSEKHQQVPRSLVVRTRNGGVAILRNPDTHNPIGMLFINMQGLSGLDVPHPEW